ncbi:citrate synthase [Entophlyctis sp. JEL0112]|nr:citrate synthase [Entophlyctis sp. JEL0112]
MATARVKKEIAQCMAPDSPVKASNEHCFVGFRKNADLLLKSNDPHECQKVEMIGDTITHLKGSFKGPEGTPYEGGVFEVDIRISQEYPFKPPQMKSICLDILKDQWSPVLTLKTALISLQSLMSDPAADNPQDAMVAKHYLSDRSGFDETARLWTRQYAGAPTNTSSDADYIDPSIDRAALQRLCDMGFDKKQAAEALKKFNGNETRAVEALLGPEPAPPKYTPRTSSMSAKAIREYDGKLLLSHWLPKAGETAPTFLASGKVAHVAFSSEADVVTKLTALESSHPWLLTERLVCKPDQLIKRRGKNGLLGINLQWPQVKAWIAERALKPIKIDRTTGVLNTFIIEPFVPHPQDTEFYICIQSVRDGDLIFFTHEGGVDVGDVDAKAKKLLVPVNKPFPSAKTVAESLLSEVKKAKHDVLIDFITRLYSVYTDLQFTYLEINPLVVTDDKNVYYLDLAAKLDQTAEFESGKKWSAALAAGAAAAGKDTPAWGPSMEFPAPFGRDLTAEEAYIAELDAKTGASLKLTVLNPKGRIWTMVAGGGASVVYSDAIAGHGYAHELANYGEYSGAPSESQTYEYAKTVLDLMTRGEIHPDGKFLFIGGGIANFTNVASTFKGIIRALKDYQKPLLAHKVKIYVRRAGPNFQEGLRMIKAVGEQLELDMHVFGPEMHVTGIVPLALKGETKHVTPNPLQSGGHDLLSISQPPPTSVSAPSGKRNVSQSVAKSIAKFASSKTVPMELDGAQNVTFTNTTRSFVYGMQPRAVQGMLDFDFMCKRSQPSVACMIYPFGGHHVQKFYWGTKETLLPVYTSLEEAMSKFPDVDVLVNFASFRSVYESTMDILKFPQIKTIAIIAEGVPEKRARQLLHTAKEKGVLIIGPATVGGIKPGCFKIGNTGGMMDNIVSSLLYRPGSVAYVSKSGGMSNELNNIISRATNGVCEGVAIGGDRYPGSTFIDHMLRYEKDPSVKILVLLGEVGGVEEYEIAKAVKSGLIKKPVVAWCIGTCAKMFTTDVQFGHAGSFANSDLETAEAKNAALREAGVIVPDTFEDMPDALQELYEALVKNGTIAVGKEPEVPKIPIDYAWAQELGLIRKPASFISTICDDRGQELLYAGVAISEVFKEDVGIGGVLSLLWFKRRLPSYAAKFIEMVLMLTADHGPAVSGAHNTIVTARAGRDLVSSLVSGLLTIGERFGGALDGAAQSFSAAFDKGLSPQEFVDSMRKNNKLILGIGHKIKSRTNPDLRVQIVKEFVFAHFGSCDILKYALEVEKITTSKKDNLILNVDGAIGVAFVDLLRGCGAFSAEESEEYVKIGALNGLFVLGRSIGFIGHYLDQKRLKQGLYRHPWDDISYLVPEGTMNQQSSRTMVEGKVAVERGTVAGNFA